MSPTKEDEPKIDAVSAKEPKKEPKNDAEELSEEDAQLKSELEMLVERLHEANAELYQPALDKLKEFIQDSTSSMTAVPKPLKFLRPLYPLLCELHSRWTDSTLQSNLADVLSVLGMTYSDTGNHESLKYRLLSRNSEIGTWGHEYVRHLALEIGDVYTEKLEAAEPADDLLRLALDIVPFFLKHNAEADAVDLLLEIEAIDHLPQFVDSLTYARVCLYMVSCVPLLAPPDDLAFLNTAFQIYLSQGLLTQALAVAIRIDDESLIQAVFDATTDELVHKQLGLILSRQNSSFKTDNQDVQDCIANVKLAEHFRHLITELNLLDPKVPEDVYKSHLESTKFGIGSGSVDSAKQNLAASFVNAFINMGFGSDKLLAEKDSKSWIYKTKGAGMLSTTASLGAIHQWDVNEGLQVLDAYLYSAEDDIKAGALLGMGIASATVHDEVDLSLLLLQDYVTNPSKKIQTSAITGLGISFAGSKNPEVLDLLLPLVTDTDQPIEVSAMAALALGHVFVGTCHGEITSAILQTLLERDFAQLENKWIRFMSLGLGLLYMGKYEQVDDVLETISAIEHPIAKTLKVLVTIASYAGTGNVLQIQELLQMCTAKPKSEEETEEDSEEKESDEAEVKEDAEDKSETPEGESAQGYAVLGLACIAMGEQVGQDMSLRHFAHLMHYGNPLIKRAVPLAMGIVSASNPQMKVFDTLSRYSHDSDLEVAINAIYSMGIVGAGTNNARLAQLLRQLASYYSREPDSLFTVRVAQGLVHLGKGTLSLNPFNTDRQILSKVSLAGLLTVAVTLLDPKSFILDEHHSLLYYLTPAIKPRMLVTLDEELQPIKVNVRVGQAVDVVGQAGKPKTITGWVTHSTPVLLGHGERAELENDEYISLASSMEGVVILRKNPEYVEIDS
ncbi:hypothetical protein BABINDRAFT_104969 [Babjeviella inositovora NRRL Y-12698]|uniref:26S proteasome regulatory subunit RPN1 n=1 Tax=Babjeviella inositovora NRRL Y-12698 TaxID=984486 RepID=A0A1E3QHN8_9ASCO|nr:uncharacterized protein BABINDRAFT_104969 [Babjeviella inositovora NRRL Y-12698]ODQ77118.1 hypothetical protein BABINDRAFT_104969 [Babjeviella inositovora NRRL Y-12698]